MRAILIVMDSVGCGELPDASKFGDFDVNTLKHTAEAVNGLKMPNLAKMGLGNITKIEGVAARANPSAYWGKMREKAPAKDTTVGHWEMTGVVVRRPFPLFPKGFPEDLTKKFTELTGFEILGNKVASGTEIIKELGAEHLKTGKVIIYTSGDSVFQIAANESIVPVKKLYEICQIARDKILVGPYNVGRVIARPFIGTDASDFKRTSNRRDFSVLPPSDTVLDLLKGEGFEVAGVGKIHDIFAGKGITKWVHTSDNDDSVNETIAYMKEIKSGLIFTNLVDFDMLYGHRRDPLGYAKALENFDAKIPAIIGQMRGDDLLILTADHGNDPTFTRTTDHTREYVPLIVYKKGIKGGSLGLRLTFADIGQTISDMFGLRPLKNGISFLDKIV